MKMALTSRQSEILEFIRNFSRLNQMPPTRLEIAEYFNWASPNAAQDHLKSMEKRGWVVIKQNLSRGIYLV